jgi:replication initiation and membrane attachment protein DnaB
MANSVMDQRIFKMGLDTEAVSLYLLCCSLVDESLHISSKHIGERWTGNAEQLSTSMHTLIQRNILRQVMTDGKTTVYTLLDPDGWRAW